MRWQSNDGNEYDRSAGYLYGPVLLVLVGYGVDLRQYGVRRVCVSAAELQRERRWRSWHHGVFLADDNDDDNEYNQHDDDRPADELLLCNCDFTNGRILPGCWCHPLHAVQRFRDGSLRRRVLLQLRYCFWPIRRGSRL